MPNISRPSGLKAVRFISGASWSGEAELHYVSASDATAIYVGDLVQFDTTNRGSASTAQFPGLPAIKQYAAGQTNARGVVIGFLPEPEFNQNAFATLMRKYRVASTERYALVVVDPNVVFEIEEHASSTKSVSDIGKNMDIAVVAGNVNVGVSQSTLANAASATTATLPLRLYRYSQRIGNEIGQYAKWDVLLNTSDLKNSTGL